VGLPACGVLGRVQAGEAAGYQVQASDAVRSVPTEPSHGHRRSTTRHQEQLHGRPATVPLEPTRAQGGAPSPRPDRPRAVEFRAPCMSQAGPATVSG
jgi:hypothetical protein